MIIALILLAIGFLFVFIEFFVPGIFMGVVGGFVILGSIILFGYESGSTLATIAFILGSSAGMVLLVKFALWRIQNSRPEYSIYSADNQEGYYASKKLHKADVGRTATTLTELRPGGYVDFEGQRVPAISKMGYIPKGSEVEIIAIEEENLIVKMKR